MSYIVLQNGIEACLNFIDFFGIVPQRNALVIAANCCSNMTASDFDYVKPCLELLTSRLAVDDRKCVESVCAIFSKLVMTYQSQPEVIAVIASHGLIANLQRILLTPSIVSNSSSFTLTVRMLAQICAACPELACVLLQSRFAETLRYLLTGSAAGSTVDVAPSAAPTGGVGRSRTAPKSLSSMSGNASNLAGSPNNKAHVELSSRNPQEIFELICLAV